MFPSCLTVLPCSCSARRGPLGRSAMHIWFVSHTFPFWWASQALCFNCKALSDWVQLICMFVCLPAWAIGNPFSPLRERKLRQPLSGLIELATQGVLHHHAGLDVENALGWLFSIAAEDQVFELFSSPLEKYYCNPSDFKEYQEAVKTFLFLIAGHGLTRAPLDHENGACVCRLIQTGFFRGRLIERLGFLILWR